MPERYRNVTVKLVFDDETPVEPSIVDATSFLQCAFKLNLSRVTAEAAPTMKLDDSLGHLWNKITPVEGKYLFEIGTELPYYLPGFDGKSEFIVNVGLNRILYYAYAWYEPSSVKAFRPPMVWITS